MLTSRLVSKKHQNKVSYHQTSQTGSEYVLHTRHFRIIHTVAKWSNLILASEQKGKNQVKPFNFCELDKFWTSLPLSYQLPRVFFFAFHLRLMIEIPFSSWVFEETPSAFKTINTMLDLFLWFKCGKPHLRRWS